MFEPSESSRCFALPPGCDFSACFLQGLQDRLKGQQPEAIARVEILVNTQRTKRRLLDLLLQGAPGFLPRIRVISDLASDPSMLADIPPAVSGLRRRLELSQTIAALIRNEPDLAPLSATYDLADSLAGLMDEMHGEGVTTEALRDLNVEGHAAHWDRNLKFLNILSPFFDDESEPDREARQRLVVEHLAARWAANPPTHPIIVAGSTGSRGATALLMQAVSQLPNGAVVLPGFDFDLPETVLETLYDHLKGSDHPQSALVRLIGSLDLDPGDIPKWSAVEPPHPERNKLVSLALRPAPVTDQWLSEGPKLSGLDLATKDISLVEAASQREEAMVIALRLRKAAEDGQRATLISPDRLLTRQVTAALERWNIVPDDSAGRPLPLTPPGILLRLVSELAIDPPTTDAVLILLKHPLTHSAGDERNLHLLRTRDLELQVLRGGPPFPDFDAIDRWAAKRDRDPGSVAWTAWLRSCFATSDRFDRSPLATHLDSHRKLAEAIADGSVKGDEVSELWLKPAGQEAAKVFKELEDNADAGGAMSAAEYAALFRSVLNNAEVREPVTAHPDIMIWGTLEARVQGADLVILGGLNDGSWPKLPDPDPWLNRTMRAEAGLLLPERRIGLSAHDFEQAIAAKEVMLTRAVRDADAPTVASRWLIRLTNLLLGLGPNGKEALEGMQRRGANWRHLVTQLETPAVALPAQKRPSPQPPVESRPGKLSVTQIKTLIRDPYAIYARKILRLDRLDPIRREPDAMLRGQALHLVLEEFVKDTLDHLPANAAQQLLDQAEQIFARDVPWPATRRLWLARLGRVAAQFVADEATRRSRGVPVVFETPGKIDLGEPAFVLTGKADRIDRTEDGGLIIYDYKTGAVPSKAQIEHFDKQLPLEATMAERGAFEGLDPLPVSGLEYIGLGSGGKIQAVDISDDLVAEAWEGLRKLIRAYQTPSTGYTARARMEKRTDPSDYDHLSRRGEWEDSDPAVPEDLT